MNISPQKENTLIALSGGVDSAVSAAILKHSGTPVEAVYVRTWEHEDDILVIARSQRFSRCRKSVRPVENSLPGGQFRGLYQRSGRPND